MPSSIESSPSGVRQWSKHGYTICSTYLSNTKSFEIALIIFPIEVTDATAAKMDSPSSSFASWPMRRMYYLVKYLQISTAYGWISFSKTCIMFSNEAISSSLSSSFINVKKDLRTQSN